MSQTELFFIYFVVYMIIGFVFWMIAEGYGETAKSSLSRGLFWPIWFLIYFLKFIIYTGMDIFETLKKGGD